MKNAEVSSGNVYQDLGIADPESMLVKASLTSKIQSSIRARQLTQIQAAEILGMSQPKLSKMLRGQFHGISESKMLECLTRLGHDVQIVVSGEKRANKIGRVSVQFLKTQSKVALTKPARKFANSRSKTGATKRTQTKLSKTG